VANLSSHNPALRNAAERATDEIVGVHIMGAEAGELIATAAVAMSMEAIFKTE